MAGRQQVRQEERAPQAQPRKKKRVRRFYNYSLLFTVIFVTVFGLVMIYSASSYTAQLMYGDAGYFMKRQALIAAGGFVVMIIVSKINYHFFAKFAAISYVLSYVLMIAVSLVGRVVNGKRRWAGHRPLELSAHRVCESGPDRHSGGGDHPHGRTYQPAEKYGAGGSHGPSPGGAGGGQQLKFRHYHLRNRICHAVCGHQEEADLRSLRGGGSSGVLLCRPDRPWAGGHRSASELSAGTDQRVA